MYIGNTHYKPNLLLNNDKLAVVDTVKDLGVTIDYRLTFDVHVRQIVARAFVRANLIHKCFVSRDIITLMRAFKVYVRPIIEYASCVWSPYRVNQVKQIESVQRKFTKRLPGYALLSYRERLQRLGLESLEMRRLRCDLLYTYKIVFGLTSEAAKNMFTFTSSLYSINTRGHAYKLYPHNNRINVRKHFFCERVITPWNSLPAIAEDFCSLSSFKCFLNSTDLSMYVSLGF
jgi:hypothetical protein